MRRLSTTFLVLSAVAGCATTPPPAPPPKPPEPVRVTPPGPTPPVLEGGWRLMFLDGVNGALPVGPTLKLAPDAVNGQESGQSGALSATGFAGCGDFTTPATRAGVSIRFTMPTPAPKESCPSEVRILENQYITALSAARRLTIRGGYLVLMDEGGRDRAYFVPG